MNANDHIRESENGNATRLIDCFSNCITNELTEWYVVGASAIGKGHLKDSIPCQDYHALGMINSQWGIAVVCDGAGSAKHSDQGAHVVSLKAVEVFKKCIEDAGIHEQIHLPDDATWCKLALKALHTVYSSVEEYANSRAIDLHSLSCTTIVIVFSQVGLMVTHIGDGRAGYRNQAGEWKSIITPHKGEEANQTIFVTSKYWQENQGCRLSEVMVPESRVIRDAPSAFTLMTDGCEMHSFECSKLDPETDKWSDPNIPFKGFFDPIYETLKEWKSSNISCIEANVKWGNFVKEGTKRLHNETDDKTILIGILN